MSTTSLHSAQKEEETWVLADDVTGVLDDLVVLLHAEQTLAVVEGQGVAHLLQLQPGGLPCFFLGGE